MNTPKRRWEESQKTADDARTDDEPHEKSDDELFEEGKVEWQRVYGKYKQRIEFFTVIADSTIDVDDSDGSNLDPIFDLMHVDLGQFLQKIKREDPDRSNFGYIVELFTSVAGGDMSASYSERVNSRGKVERSSMRSRQAPEQTDKRTALFMNSALMSKWRREQASTTRPERWEQFKMRRDAAVAAAKKATEERAGNLPPEFVGVANEPTGPGGDEVEEVAVEVMDECRDTVEFFVKVVPECAELTRYYKDYNVTRGAPCVYVKWAGYGKMSDITIEAQESAGGTMPPELWESEMKKLEQLGATTAGKARLADLEHRWLRKKTRYEAPASD